MHLRQKIFHRNEHRPRISGRFLITRLLQLGDHSLLTFNPTFLTGYVLAANLYTLIDGFQNTVHTDQRRNSANVLLTCS